MKAITNNIPEKLKENTKYHMIKKKGLFENDVPYLNTEEDASTKGK
jgi:hypothetical protein